MSKIKQVIVIRRDLNMRRGKEIAQGAHAANAAIVEQMYAIIGGGELDLEVHEWLQNGFKKVTVTVETIEDLMYLHQKAQYYGLRSHFIEDEGITEFHNVPTITCLAIGPNQSDEVDKVTGNLKLY